MEMDGKWCLICWLLSSQSSSFLYCFLGLFLLLFVPSVLFKNICLNSIYPKDSKAAWGCLKTAPIMKEGSLLLIWISSITVLLSVVAEFIFDVGYPEHICILLLALHHISKLENLEVGKIIYNLQVEQFSSMFIFLLLRSIATCLKCLRDCIFIWSFLYDFLSEHFHMVGDVWIYKWFGLFLCPFLLLWNLNSIDLLPNIRERVKYTRTLYFCKAIVSVRCKLFHFRDAFQTHFLLLFSSDIFY